MKTITIDILNEKAMDLLRDLELLDLIRLRHQKPDPRDAAYWAKYKGAMSSKPQIQVDQQLNELRSEWE